MTLPGHCPPGYPAGLPSDGFSELSALSSESAFGGGRRILSTIEIVRMTTITARLIGEGISGMEVLIILCEAWSRSLTAMKARMMARPVLR